jgi:hypothetical protein
MIRLQMDLTVDGTYRDFDDQAWRTTDQTRLMADEIAELLREQGFGCVREEDESEEGQMYQQVRLTDEGKPVGEDGYFCACVLVDMAFISIESWSEDADYPVELAACAALIKAVERVSRLRHLDSSIPELEQLLID